MSANIEPLTGLPNDLQGSLFSASNGRTLFNGQQLQLAASCRDQVRAASVHVNFAEDQPLKSPGSIRISDVQPRSGGKRHFSFSADDKHVGSKQRRYSERFGSSTVASSFRKRGGRGGRHHPGDRSEKIVLPTRFLLGGSITDPLNLNSLCDETVNRSMNENTPVSSPLPVPVYKLEVPVRIPANVADPLNLNNVNIIVEEQSTSTQSSWSMFKKRRKRKRRQRKLDPIETTQTEELSLVKPLHVETDARCDDKAGRLSKDLSEAVSDAKSKRIIDHIVSPVIPQMSQKWKRRRTTSEGKPEVSGEFKSNDAGVDKMSSDRTTPVKYKKRIANQTLVTQSEQAKCRARNRKLCLGNYTHCVISRNVLGHYEDPRLSCFTTAMFSGKDVLDIGCGVGHVALSIAKDLNPQRVVAIDIDNHLINAAKKNLRHFIGSTMSENRQFPIAFKSFFGPLAVPQIHEALPKKLTGFPHNIKFVQENYVLESDSLVEDQTEEYDIILALNITKWIHLNYGDVGLTRAFRRMYCQLRPGGRLVLETQPWDTYRKKKKVTRKIYETYKSIRLHPDDFHTYLLSQQVGFVSCQQLRVPSNTYKSLKRAVYVYMKPMPEDLLASHTRSTVEADVPWYQTRSKTIDCIRCLDGPLSDTMSSCGWLTPQCRVGSASCSTTPCCSTTCRNTPIPEDCVQEDDYVAAVVSSLPIGVAESLDDSRSRDSFSRDVASSSSLVTNNDASKSSPAGISPFHLSPRSCPRTDDVPSESVGDSIVRNLVCSEGDETSISASALRTSSASKD